MTALPHAPKPQALTPKPCPAGLAKVVEYTKAMDLQDETGLHVLGNIIAAIHKLLEHPHNQVHLLLRLHSGNEVMQLDVIGNVMQLDSLHDAMQLDGVDEVVQLDSVNGIMCSQFCHTPQACRILRHHML